MQTPGLTPRHRTHIETQHARTRTRTHTHTHTHMHMHTHTRTHAHTHTRTHAHTHTRTHAHTHTHKRVPAHTQASAGTSRRFLRVVQAGQHDVPRDLVGVLQHPVTQEGRRARGWRHQARRKAGLRHACVQTCSCWDGWRRGLRNRRGSHPRHRTRAGTAAAACRFPDAQ